MQVPGWLPRISCPLQSCALYLMGGIHGPCIFGRGSILVETLGIPGWEHIGKGLEDTPEKEQPVRILIDWEERRMAPTDYQ